MCPFSLDGTESSRKKGSFFNSFPLRSSLQFEKPSSWSILLRNKRMDRYLFALIQIFVLMTNFPESSTGVKGALQATMSYSNF